MDLQPESVQTGSDRRVQEIFYREKASGAVGPIEKDSGSECLHTGKG